MLTPYTVRRIAMKTLALTDGFILRSRRNNRYLESASHHAKQTVIGVYINTSKCHLTITDTGIEINSGDKTDFVSYADITHITEPAEGEQDLDLLLENEKFDDVRSYAIPVLGKKYDEPDIFEFYNFLTAISEFLVTSPIQLRTVTSMKELISYLRTECEWEEYTGALANYLENEFDPDAWTELDIDRDMLAKPDFWQALAVLLNVPMKLSVDQVRDGIEWEGRAELYE